MNKKSLFIVLGIGVALIGVIGLTLLLISEPQDTRSRADNTQPLAVPSASPTDTLAQTQQSCPAPAQVGNVKVDYPNCIGDVCNFTEASCSWDAVAGSTQFGLTITEVETGTVVRDELIEAAITRVEFPVKQKHTYKCDVSAINSCGGVGVAGTHSLYCETDALVEETPTPTAPPLVACGSPCSATSQCQAGLTCAVSSSGQGYCAVPSFQNACLASPSVSACCSAPTPPPEKPTAVPTSTPTPVPPTIPPTGGLGQTIAMGGGVALLILLGIALIVL